MIVVDSASFVKFSFCTKKYYLFLYVSNNSQKKIKSLWKRRNGVTSLNYYTNQLEKNSRHCYCSNWGQAVQAQARKTRSKN